MVCPTPIDRSFVVSMTENRESERIVRAIAGLAKDLDMNIVAEGIETVGQMQQIKALGCEYGQGCLFSRPLSKDAVLRYLGQLPTWTTNRRINTV